MTRIFVLVLLLVFVSRLAFAAGDHILSDGMGGYFTPDGGHIQSDGRGGYFAPDGKHIQSDGMGGWFK
jgi:hypothetical protein